MKVNSICGLNQIKSINNIYKNSHKLNFCGNIHSNEGDAVEFSKKNKTSLPIQNPIVDESATLSSKKEEVARINELAKNVLSDADNIQNLALKIQKKADRAARGEFFDGEIGIYVNINGKSKLRCIKKYDDEDNLSIIEFDKNGKVESYMENYTEFEDGGYKCSKELDLHDGKVICYYEGYEDRHIGSEGYSSHIKKAYTFHDNGNPAGYTENYSACDEDNSSDFIVFFKPDETDNSQRSLNLECFESYNNDSKGTESSKRVYCIKNGELISYSEGYQKPLMGKATTKLIVTK